MDPGYVLNDVKVVKVLAAATARSPVFTTESWKVSQNEFSMIVDEVGSFYVRDGCEAQYSPFSGADPDWVRLVLNGQVLVALLHQRKVISFHASSFVFDGLGVMILGESGAGKSSLTASFALEGAGFLTDDITPVVYSDGYPQIWSLQEVIRIRRSTASQLRVDASMLREAEAGTDKQYMKAKHAGVSHHPLDIIIKIEVGETDAPLFDRPSPADRFTFLRSEICMSEMLAGMPETERSYLLQLLQIVERVHFVRVTRPAEIAIRDLNAAVSDYLGKKDLRQ